MYHYAGNNPVKYTDPTGEVLETAWDAFSLATGIQSFVENIKSGNVKGAVLDGLGIVADTAALALPCVPGGTGALIKGSRVADKLGDAKDLHRPYIRKSTREAVESNALKTADGKFIDPNTGIVIDGKYDLGHKPGNEFRTEKAKAKSEGLTQKEFNDRMNNPDLYQIEDPHTNRSHKFELKETLE